MATGIGAARTTTKRRAKARKSAARTKTNGTSTGSKAGNFATKVSDDAVSRATGRTWPQWFKTLDNAGCAKMNHKQIVAVVEKHYSGGWWGQMVTVGYEQARGLRQLYEKCDGDFQASSSKTVGVAVGRLFDAWNDPRLRAKWLDDGDGRIVIRKATRPKSLRITWRDGRTSLDVNLYPKGQARSYVSMQHTKLKDGREVEKLKRYWAGRFEKMKAVLEA